MEMLLIFEPSVRRLPPAWVTIIIELEVAVFRRCTHVFTLKPTSVTTSFIRAGSPLRLFHSICVPIFTLRWAESGIRSPERECMHGFFDIVIRFGCSSPGRQILVPSMLLGRILSPLSLDDVSCCCEHTENHELFSLTGAFELRFFTSVELG